MNSTIFTILVADAEQPILELIQRQLQGEGWDCHFVTNAQDALDFLKKKPVDLVLTGTKTGPMSGIQLLAEIHKFDTTIVRILLTEHSKQNNVVKALATGQVQQIIPKPWIEQELKEIIRSVIRQRAHQKKYSPELQILMNSIHLLPSLPESYANVHSCIVGDQVNIEKMAHYISQDVAISSALLHWANSALFGQRFQLDTIKKAIIVLGTDIVENLILSEAINSTIASKLPKIKGFDFGKFKQHSMATAVIARLLLKSIRPTDFIQHDRAFVAGLLHDLGKLAAASFFPLQFEKAIELANQRTCPLPEAEVLTYGTHHAELGNFLAEWWTLPPFIVNAICWHHQPHATAVDLDVIAATHVANLLSYQFEYGSNGDTCLREIPSKYCEKFYLTEEANEILRTEMDQTLRAIVR